MLDTPDHDPVFAFDNSYARLPERFFARQLPTPVAAPRLIRLNEGLARELGLDPAAMASAGGVSILAGNRIPPGAEPIATAYAGHQFGGFSPQLGDGRAILLGEIIAPDGARFDMQLKGSGPTKFSRSGDGRAALGPVLREYIVSEAMHALGIPTTRALAAVTTGEMVHREKALPGGVLTRVASSHIRVGTFQFFAARRDVDGVRTLADYVMARHYADTVGAANPYLALLEGVIERQAKLIARWMLVGFIHGVMNTDNSSVAGETIDYGPCAFMDGFDPATVYSSIDAHGRYAYENQPRIAHWNLTRLAETLVPLLADDQETAVALAQTALDAFPAKYTEAYTAGLCAKLGLSEVQPGDAALGQDLLDLMAKNKADFTNTFRALCDAGQGPELGRDARALIVNVAEFDAWALHWHERMARDPSPLAARRDRMRLANPAYIPRNHRVEEVIAAAVNNGDFKPFEMLLKVLATPYDDQPEMAAFRAPPEPEQVVRATFCGT